MGRSAIRVVFLGTPDFAVPSLEALIAHPSFRVYGVVTQPDRPAGRGQQILKSAVKRAAEKHQLPVFQPDSLRDPTAVEHLRAWSPEMLVVTAFGQILRQPVLDLPTAGCINVHASLLPRWRGAAPIQYAIRAGDTESGITIMKMDAGLDTGPIVSQAAISVMPDETASSLHDRLASLAAEILPGVLLKYVNHEILPHPQPEMGVTLAPTLKKSDGQIDWSRPALEIDRHVRALNPWPGTFTLLHGDLLRVIGGMLLTYGAGRGHPAGSLTLHKEGLAVQTGDGLYLIREVQPAGRQKMSAVAFARGRRDLAGAVLASPD